MTTSLAEGSTLGPYRLLARAGSGASADVFQAEGPGGAVVALKVARTPDIAAALAREAKHAALALSPRLPELSDVGVLPDGRAFLALRWTEGEAIDPKHVYGDRIALALRVAAGVGEALADLHGVGVAHGDVKPANVIAGDRAGGACLIDLGLAGPAYATAISGATPRYLARGDADLGDARARDLIALGAMIAEIADPHIAASSDPVATARATKLPMPIASICAALLAPSPGARPSAAWVAEMAGTGATEADRVERRARSVRAAYLGVRRAEIEEASSVREDDVAPWLADAVAWSRRAQAIGGEAPREGLVLGAMGPDQVARWLTALAGSAAAAWPIATIAKAHERALADALVALAKRVPPEAWTLTQVEAAARGEVSGAAHGEARRRFEGPIDAGEAARLAIAIARVPADAYALTEVERRADAPHELVIAAADALRLGGQLGRARSLVLRDDVRLQPGAAALAADVLRRAGDLALAEESARRAIVTREDPEGRARGTLARIAIDRGDVAEAEEIAGHPDAPRSPAIFEALALAASARGDVAKALVEAARGDALAATAEERARMAGLRGYVIHGADPEAARLAFAIASDHAARAGAVVEEATYRTGEAAAAVDVGDLGGAIATARRAALLWDHLGRPALAARARVAAAAALATAGAAHDAASAAREAIARAREGGDALAEAYALWAIADVADVGSSAGVDAAERAAKILEGAPRSDEIRAAARLVQHGSTAIDRARIVEIDRLASSTSQVDAGARLDWWGARARRADQSEPHVLSAIMGLADTRASLGARGPALAAGVDLAARTGQGDIAQRLLSALGEVAREIVRRAPPDLAAQVRALPWVTRAAAAPESVLRPEQARDLEALIRGLGDRERLGPLLGRIVDALVLWTGVERGLLLLRAPDGRLAPRAARNLARSDLGPDQMRVSQSLARRALEAREPVIAVDADVEMGAIHQSIHALSLRSVLAVPLIARGEPLGVVYLDDRIRKGAFGPREIEWARTIASLAALVIADARDHVLLRRAARQARRASEKLAETLSLREAALDAAERELAKARGGRETRFAYEGLVGASEATRAMLRLVDRVTASEVPVLVIGESGSGKELVARAIHDNGPRKGRPFVGENCGAFPEGLLESALFGHVRGAFTGADRQRAGLFEVADKGTLFLDEIGEMSLGMQTKLLRVLEDGIVRPVGAERARKVDVRVIAATNRDLAEMVKAKTFREDLFYRLDIISVRVPPLREREGDVPLLVQRFLEVYGAGRKVRITSAAMDRLSAYAWPGNVRQLQNEIRRALVLADGTIDVDHLSADIAGDAAPRETGLHVRRRIDQLEHALVREAMSRTDGNQTQAAKLLGLSRFGLQKMIKRLEIG